jgi:hypothetical protein
LSTVPPPFRSRFISPVLAFAHICQTNKKSDRFKKTTSPLTVVNALAALKTPGREHITFQGLLTTEAILHILTHILGRAGITTASELSLTGTILVSPPDGGVTAQCTPPSYCLSLSFYYSPKPFSQVLPPFLAHLMPSMAPWTSCIGSRLEIVPVSHTIFVSPLVAY